MVRLEAAQVAMKEALSPGNLGGTEECSEPVAEAGDPVEGRNRGLVEARQTYTGEAFLLVAVKPEMPCLAEQTR
jgi:hypothetical protein